MTSIGLTLLVTRAGRWFTEFWGKDRFTINYVTFRTTHDPVGIRVGKLQMSTLERCRDEIGCEPMVLDTALPPTGILGVKAS